MIHLPKLLCPPSLEQAIGYEGDARHVAFYWHPNRDTVVHADGRSTGTGDWQPWLLFVNHWKTSPFLMGAICPICEGVGCADCHRKGFVAAKFGDRHLEPEHWLLLDRLERSWSMGAVKEVQRFLIEQHPAPLLSQQDWGAVAAMLSEGFIEGAATLLAEDMRSALSGGNQQAEAIVQWLESTKG